MVRHKRSRAVHIGAALVVSMIGALVGCGASNDPDENASSTSAAISNEKDGCTTTKQGTSAHLADFGIGFATCPLPKTGLKCVGETALLVDLNAAGCRRCVYGDGSNYVTEINAVGQREVFEWWCAVCPQSAAVNSILTNPQYTAAPLGVRTPRSCSGTDVLRNSAVGWVPELLVEWDPRCPGGACSTPPNGGS